MNIIHSQHQPQQYKSRLICMAFVLIAFGSSAFAQRTDTITLTDGTTVRGKIVNSFKKGLQVESAGGNKNLTANTIRSVRFGGEPSALKQAKDALAKGDLESANRALERAADAKIDRDLIKQEFEFVTAQLAAQTALQSGQGHSPAAKQMFGFLKAHDSSFHFYDASETLGKLAAALGQFTAASKYFARLEGSPWPDVQLRGSALMAEALRAQGPERLQDVLERYERIASSEGGSPEIERQKTIAVLGRAAVAAELGQPRDVTEIESIIAKTDSANAEIMARAYNALGAYYRSKQQDTDAVLAYLHVDLLFASHQTAHPEALYHLSQLWGKLDKPDRGVDAGNRLKANYAGSSWAKR